MIRLVRWNRSLFWLWWLLALSVLLSRCSITAPQNPGADLALFVKARIFIESARFLAVAGQIYWGQSLRAIYYCAFTLARLRHRHLFLKKESEIHSRVWAASPQRFREYFGGKLKGVRGRHDYDPILQPNDASGVDREEFLRDGIPELVALCDEAESRIADVWKKCPEGKCAICRKCEEASASSCMRIQAKQEVDKIRKVIAQLSSIDA